MYANMHKNLQAMIAVKSNNAIKKQVHGSHGTLVMGCGSYTASGTHNNH